VLYNLKDKIVAIPRPLGSYALPVAGTVLEADGRLILGAAPEKLELLKGAFRGERNVFCQRLNFNSARSFRAFFKKTYTRFGRPDVLVLRAISSSAGVSLKSQTEHASRELLRCLDALAPWIGKEVHIIVIAPAFFGRVAVSIATEFFKLKFVTTQPVIRMTTVATDMQADGANAIVSNIIMAAGNQDKALPVRRTKSRSSANAPNLSLRMFSPKISCHRLTSVRSVSAEISAYSRQAHPPE
jgi:hypothetical protein